MAYGQKASNCDPLHVLLNLTKPITCFTKPKTMCESIETVS